MFPAGASSPEITDCSLDEVVEQARAVSSQIAQLQARQVALVAEIDRRATTFDGTTTAFVAWQCGLQPGEARRALSLARRLPSLPLVEGAFTRGTLSEATVRLLATVATPANEAELLHVAESATAAQLATLVRRYRRVRDEPDDDERSPDDDRRSDVEVGWHDDRLDLRADLDTADGIDLEQALRLAGERIRSDRRAHGTGGPLEGLLPDEVVTATSAEALMRLARAYVAGEATESGLVPEGHHTLIVTSDRELAAHAAGRAPVGDPTHVAGGPSVPAWLGAARACHGSVSALVVHHGRPVTTTVDARFASAAQKRALLLRDHCCAFPGCGLAVGLIAHHVVEYDHGGPTRLDNLVLLCPQHHNLVHRRRYTVDIRGPGPAEFTRSDGRPVPPVHPRPPPAETGPPPPPGHRYRPAREPLTAFAADNILHRWATRDGADVTTAPRSG